MELNIVIYPDPRLLARCLPVGEVTPEVSERVARMFELMYELQGVGLAAPQVGWSVRLFVMNPTGDPNQPNEQRVVIDPRILKRRGREWGQEGCLSFPGMYVEVERAPTIAVRATDLDGAVSEYGLSDFPARVFQHELDHLDSVLLAHRMSAADKIKHKDALDRLRRKAAQPAS